MSAAGGPVDRYLDEMFDLLAGTGADGRRLLIEAEEHLTEAAADGRAHGLDAEAAERAAVDRFGAAATVARRVPGGTGTVRISLPRLTTVMWALTGAILLWYGLSGALVRLLSWPWTRLLIATDRFGEHPMCELPGYPVALDDCVRMYRPEAVVFPGVDNSLTRLVEPIAYPDLLLAGLGAVLLVALLVLRRTTALGAPRWTPSSSPVYLMFAVLFGLAGGGLFVEAIDGVLKNVQNYVLADIVTGLSAVLIGAVALRQARKAEPPMTKGLPTGSVLPSAS